MFDIPIYMHTLLTSELEEEICDMEDEPFLEKGKFKDTYFGPRAAWLLSNILSSLELDRSDEIAILTTSGETYVSTCISITCFNFSKISRVVSKNTKVIILIHEFGWIMDDLEEKVKVWKENGICIIEDCAHIAGIKFDGKMVGEFGDFAIFSLPKIIPVTAGGLLKTNYKIKLKYMNLKEEHQMQQGLKSAEHYLPKINWFLNRKYKKYKLAKIFFDTLIFEPSERGCPFFICLLEDRISEKKKSIEGIEFGATLNMNKLFIPNNPLVTDEQYYIKFSEIKNG